MKLSLMAASLIMAGVPAMAAERDCSLLQTTTREQRITKQVCDGLDYRDAYREALAIETAAREALGSDIPNDFIRKQTLERWNRAMEAIGPAKQGMEENFRDALNDTLVLYGIAPTNGSGDINGGPVKGGKAVWAPNYAFRTGPKQGILREIELPANGGMPARMAHLKWQQSAVEEEKAFAMTWADGRIDILDEALEAVIEKNSPGVLGYLIHHESIHFDQLRAGNWRSLNEREVDAYKASVAEASRFGLSPNDVMGLNRLLGYNRAKVWKQKVGLEKTPQDLPTPAFEAAYKSEWDKLRKALQEDIPAGRKLLQQQLELERSGRNAPSQESVPSQDHFRALKANSRYFCESPEFIHSSAGAIFSWQQALLKVQVDSAAKDLDRQFGKMPCEDYVTLQAIYLLGNGLNQIDLNGILGLVEEGLRRQIELHPRHSPERASAELQTLSERICKLGSIGIVTDETILKDWGNWARESYESVPSIHSALDASSSPAQHWCYEFIINQVRIARGARRPPSSLDYYWLRGLLESHRTATEQIIPPGLRPAPPTTTQPGPTTPPTAPTPIYIEPTPQPARPAPPTIPHCRYHPWCQG